MVCICVINYFIYLPPILKLLQNRKKIVCLFITLILLWQFIPGDFFNGIFLYPQVIKYSLYFSVGYYISNNIRDILRCKYSIVLLSISFFVFNILFVERLQFNIVIIDFVLACIGIFLFWSLSFRIEKYIYLKRYLTFVGKSSLAFYFFNGFALVPSRIIVVKLLSITNPVFIVPIVFILCMICCSIAVCIVKRFPLITKFVGL